MSDRLMMIAIGAPLVLGALALGSAVAASRQPASPADIRSATLLSPPACQAALTHAVHELYAGHPTKHQLHAASRSICRGGHGDDAGSDLALGIAIGSANRAPR